MRLSLFILCLVTSFAYGEKPYYEPATKPGQNPRPIPRPGEHAGEVAPRPRPAGSTLPDFSDWGRKIQPFAVTREASGFNVGGVNTTDTIRGLATINGRTIAQLETDMRPGGLSSSGFLTETGSLLDVMAKDNDYVRGQGLTHQDLAKHLKVMQYILNKNRIEDEGDDSKGRHREADPVVRFRYLGEVLEGHYFCTKGIQESPFQDGTGGSCEFTVKNSRSGKEMKWASLVPEMIGRYGFYEGEGLNYRVDPRSIVETLALDK